MEVSVSNNFRRTMRTELVHVIREAILNREYLPGQKLIEEEISLRFGVSRTPIREALLVLEQEGLVDNQPHVGMYVVSFRREEIIDLLRVEAAMEGLAAAEAAKRITQEEILEFETLQEEMNSRQEPVRQEEFFDYDRKIHEMLIQCSGSPTLIGILEKQLSLVYLCRFYTIRAPDRYFHSIKEHQEIIDSFKSHDSRRSEKAAQDHLESVIKDYVRMDDGKEVTADGKGN
jgi:DNA-binding GntR family transcriptional regulator